MGAAFKNNLSGGGLAELGFQRHMQAGPMKCELATLKRTHTSSKTKRHGSRASVPCYTREGGQPHMTRQHLFSVSKASY